MDLLTAIGWACSINSIIGALFIARQDRRGYLFWIGGNNVWIFLNICSSMIEQVPVWVMLTGTSTYGYMKWGIKNEESC